MKPENLEAAKAKIDQLLAEKLSENKSLKKPCPASCISPYPLAAASAAGR
jgi:hypothetical protein